MDLVMSPGSVVSQLNNMNLQLNDTVNNIHTTITNAERFAYSDYFLKGTAYDKLRSYYRAVHIPLLRAIILYADALIYENMSYMNCINGHLSGIGYIDEEGLEEDKEFIQAQIERARELMSASKASVSSLISSLEHAKSLVERKLQQISDFKGAAAGLYSSMNSYRSMVESGLQQLKGIGIVLNIRSYQTDPLSLKWAREIDKLWQTYAYFRCIQQEFGFDQETIGYMKEVYEALPIKYPEDSQMELDWRFARLMGGFYYDDNNDYINSQMKWNDVAGVPYDKDMDELTYYVEFLGIPEEHYRKLRYEVRLQCAMSSNREKYKLDDDFDQLDEKILGDFETWKNTAIRSTNIHFSTDQKFLDFWNEHYARYADKGDFAHQQITTATILAVELDKDGYLSNIFLNAGDRGVIEYAGWLGDANLPDYSFGPEDYKADLDAENITSLIKGNEVSLQEATIRYYRMLDNGASRADIFLQDHDLSYIKRQLFIKHGDYSETSDLISINEESPTEYLRETVPNVYNFIRSLEEGANEMRDYK